VNRQHWFVRRRPDSVASPLHLLQTSSSPSLLCRRPGEVPADRGAWVRGGRMEL